MTIQGILCIAGGGAVGAVARHVIGLCCDEWLGTRFPWGTLLVNVVGCLLLGILWHASSTQVISESVRLALGSGFLGAFTTFSTFGLQTVQTWERSPAFAVANVAANVTIGLAATLAGMYVVRIWNA